MSKPETKLTVNLNLLKPQSRPERLPVKIFSWLIFSGRYIFVFVEALVLIAFAARFKLDADIAAKKEAIEEQIPYIESLKPYEILIRQTQLKIATVDSIKTSAQDFPIIFKKIADQVPASVIVTAINIERNLNNATIHINGQTQNNSDLANFISGLKEDSTFSNIDLASIGLEQGIIKFTIDVSANTISLGGKSS